jgi:hypothetical protein
MAHRQAPGARVTTLQHGAKAVAAAVPARDGRIHHMVTRLHESAAREVAFSEARRLFLDAAAMLERLDAEGEAQVAAMRRLETELAHERTPGRAHGA